MGNLAFQRSKVTGAAIAMANAGVGGDTVAAVEHGIVLVRNIGAGAVNVTVAVPGTEYGQARPDAVTAVAAGGSAVFGPFPSDLADPTDNLVHLSYQTPADLRVAAIIS